MTKNVAHPMVILIVLCFYNREENVACHHLSEVRVDTALCAAGLPVAMESVTGRLTHQTWPADTLLQAGTLVLVR